MSCVRALLQGENLGGCRNRWDHPCKSLAPALDAEPEVGGGGNVHQKVTVDMKWEGGKHKVEPMRLSWNPCLPFPETHPLIASRCQGCCDLQREHVLQPYPSQESEKEEEEIWQVMEEPQVPSKVSHQIQGNGCELRQCLNFHGPCWCGHSCPLLAVHLPQLTQMSPGANSNPEPRREGNVGKRFQRV